MSAITSSTANSNPPLTGFSQPLLRTTNTVSANALVQNTAAPADTNSADPAREFVRVSSSIGRAATAGQLSRQEALDIYRQIASLL